MVDTYLTWLREYSHINSGVRLFYNDTIEKARLYAIKYLIDKNISDEHVILIYYVPSNNSVSFNHIRIEDNSVEFITLDPDSNFFGPYETYNPLNCNEFDTLLTIMNMLTDKCYRYLLLDIDVEGSEINDIQIAEYPTIFKELKCLSNIDKEHSFIKTFMNSLSDGKYLDNHFTLITGYIKDLCLNEDCYTFGLYKKYVINNKVESNFYWLRGLASGKDESIGYIIQYIDLIFPNIFNKNSGNIKRDHVTCKDISLINCEDTENRIQLI